MTWKERQWEKFIVLQLFCSHAKKHLCFCVRVTWAQEPGSLGSCTVCAKCLHEIGDCTNIWSCRGDKKMEYLGCHVFLSVLVPQLSIKMYKIIWLFMSDEQIKWEDFGLECLVFLIHYKESRVLLLHGTFLSIMAFEKERLLCPFLSSY